MGLACVLCLALGIALNAGGTEFPQRAQELFEGSVALLATAMLLSMVLWMSKAARSIKTQLREQVDVALDQPQHLLTWARRQLVKGSDSAARLFQSGISFHGSSISLSCCG